MQSIILPSNRPIATADVRAVRILADALRRAIRDGRERHVELYTRSLNRLLYRLGGRR